MARFTPVDITSTYAALSPLNTNFDSIAALFELCLMRDGSSPNSMLANLNMNSYRIENLASPANMNDAVRLQDISDLTSGEALAALLQTSGGAAYVGSTGPSTVQDDIDARPTSAVLAASGGGALIGFIQSGAGAAARTVTSKLRDVVSIKDFGAVGDGVTNDAAALEAAAAVASVVIIPNGTYLISTNKTITSDLLFIGGTFSVSVGVTLTLRGSVSAPASTIFSGSGSVVGLREVYPEWFGAVRDGTTDDLAALNKAYTCVNASKTSRGERQRIKLLGGTYGLSATWTVAPSADVGLEIEGAGTGLGGTRFTDLASFASAVTPVIHIDGQTDSIQRIANWSLKSIAIIKGAGSATIGLQIGSTSSTKGLIGNNWQAVDDVHIELFANNIKICHARQIVFNRVSSWNSTYVGACTPLLITVNGLYTSDLVFHDSCQFVSNTTSGSVCVRIEASSGDYNNATGENSVAGIRFGNCDLYAGDKALSIYASNGSRVLDIWLSETQFDQQSNYAIYAESNKNTATTPLIENLQVKGCYFAANVFDCIGLTSTGTGGAIRSCQFNGNYSYNTENRELNCFGPGIEGISFCDNEILNNNFNNGGFTGCVVDIGTAKIVTACRNRLRRDDGTKFPDLFFNIASGANHLMIRDNVSSGLLSTAIAADASGAVTKSIGDNI